MSELTVEKVVDVMRSERFVMLTSVAADGKLHSHPMTPQQITDDADVWFFVGLNTEQGEALRTNPEVNLAFAETGSWLSVAGRIAKIDDRAKVDELWNDAADAWFEGGKDDPNLGLFHFISDSAQYWGQPGGKVAALAQIAKTRVTGERPKSESGKTEL